MIDLSLLKDDYPIPSFYFKVVFADGKFAMDTSFQSVSGISAEITYEDVKEGGLNEKVYKLPTKITHPNLVLKRGITNPLSGLFLWIKGIAESDFYNPVIPKMLFIMLLNEKGWPSKVWEIHDALPVKWSMDEFNSTDNKVALETVELTYARFARIL